VSRPTTAGCLVLLLAACANSDTAIQVDDAWARPTSSGPSAAYLTIRNTGNRPDRLVGARSPCCASIEIHVTEIKDDRMSMAPVEGGIGLDPGATLRFEPAGHHLMLFDPVEPLRVGMRFEITLEFDPTGDIPVEVEVRR